MSPTEGRRLCCVESCRRAMLAGRPVLSTHLHWSHNEVFWPQPAGCSSQLWCVSHWRWARVLILHRYDCIEYLYSTGMTVLSTYTPQVWLCWLTCWHCSHSMPSRVYEMSVSISLPFSVSTLLPMFKRHLKTVLFTKSYWTLAVSDDLNTFHRTSFYLHIILFGVLAVVLTLCHLNHIRLLTN